MPTRQELEEQLNDFSLRTRMNALQTIVQRHPEGRRKRGTLNMHIHTFNSYNWRGWGTPLH